MTRGDAGYVFIIDDDPDVREAIAEVLEDVGYRTMGAGNGEEALRTLRSVSTMPCLILLDIMMPVMDGRQFRAEQRVDPRLSAIPVVVVTAHAGPGDTTEEIDAAEHLSKPIRVERLLSTVGKFCEDC